MPLHPKTPETEQSIPEMVDDLAREEMHRMYRDGKLTPYGRRMEKFLDRALPAEKVDKCGYTCCGICFFV